MKKQFIYSHPDRRITMTRSLDDIYTYERQALDLIDQKYDKTDPRYQEVKKLLTDQVQDEIRDYVSSTSN